MFLPNGRGKPLVRAPYLADDSSFSIGVNEPAGDCQGLSVWDSSLALGAVQKLYHALGRVGCVCVCVCAPGHLDSKRASHNYMNK